MNDLSHLSFDVVKEATEASAEFRRDIGRRTASVVSLFAGIGGFDLAFERAGAQVLMQCELDSFCQSVLKRHWPTVALAKDITKVDPKTVPDADIWTAGFPCQDVSLARGIHGRHGLKGTHTSLFFRLMELVEERLPKVLLLENVVGLLNSHRGCDFAVILSELTRRGYAVSWRVLNARYFGAPQSRSRVFLCAWRNDYRKAVEALFESVPGQKPERERAGFLKPTKDERTNAIVPEVSYCVAATSGRHTGNDWSRSYISYIHRVRRPTPTESERLQGFPTDWTIPRPSFPQTGRGLDSERYRAAGNAVAVPVVHWIAHRVIAALTSREKSSSAGHFERVVAQLAPDLASCAKQGNFLEVLGDAERGNGSYRWKSGGCAFGQKVVEGAAPPAPSKIVSSRFVDILDPDMPDERYFLTPNAAAGIIRRADIVGRTLFPPLRKALVKMVS